MDLQHDVPQELSFGGRHVMVPGDQIRWVPDTVSDCEACCAEPNYGGALTAAAPDGWTTGHVLTVRLSANCPGGTCLYQLCTKATDATAWELQPHVIASVQYGSPSPPPPPLPSRPPIAPGLGAFMSVWAKVVEVLSSEKLLLYVVGGIVALYLVLFAVAWMYNSCLKPCTRLLCRCSACCAPEDGYERQFDDDLYVPELKDRSPGKIPPPSHTLYAQAAAPSSPIRNVSGDKAEERAIRAKAQIHFNEQPVKFRPGDCAIM